jgi:hypothetical protein
LFNISDVNPLLTSYLHEGKHTNLSKKQIYWCVI